MRNNADIEKILTANNVAVAHSDGKITIPCPFHEKLDLADGTTLADFAIDPETGRGSCNHCGEIAEQDTWMRALGISTPKNTDSNIISGQTTLKNTNNTFPRVISTKELLECDLGQQEWIIESLLPQNGITMLAGAPASYKTWLTLEIARCVATGTPFLNKFKTTQSPVLMIDEEDNRFDLRKRLQMLSPQSDSEIYWLIQSEFKLDNDRLLEGLVNEINQHAIGLVVFDSFVRIHSKNENEARDVAFVFERLRQLTKLDVGILITHHLRKEPVGQRTSANSMRGSSDILAGLDAAMLIEHKDESILAHQSKMRVAE